MDFSSHPQCKYKDYLIEGDTSGTIYLNSELNVQIKLHGHSSQILHLVCIENFYFPQVQTAQ